jgi:Na+-transporting methylmalonyl-CoA/oxaloacetate decarboxylase gamma subunit
MRSSASQFVISHQWTDRTIDVVRGNLAEAATIAVLGVAVVMSALTILMLAIMVLTRLAPGKKENGEKATLEVVQGQSPSKESVAAVAVAVALAMEEQEADKIRGRGKSPVSRPVASPWASAGRERLMHSRRKPGQKWGRPSE